MKYPNIYRSLLRKMKEDYEKLEEIYSEVDDLYVYEVWGLDEEQEQVEELLKVVNNKLDALEDNNYLNNLSYVGFITSSVTSAMHCLYPNMLNQSILAGCSTLSAYMANIDWSTVPLNNSSIFNWFKKKWLTNEKLRIERMLSEIDQDRVELESEYDSVYLYHDSMDFEGQITNCKAILDKMIQEFEPIEIEKEKEKEHLLVLKK